MDLDENNEITVNLKEYINTNIDILNEAVEILDKIQNDSHKSQIINCLIRFKKLNSSIHEHYKMNPEYVSLKTDPLFIELKSTIEEYQKLLTEIKTDFQKIIKIVEPSEGSDL